MGVGGMATSVNVAPDRQRPTPNTGAKKYLGIDGGTKNRSLNYGDLDGGPQPFGSASFRKKWGARFRVLCDFWIRALFDRFTRSRAMFISVIVHGQIEQGGVIFL